MCRWQTTSVLCAMQVRMSLNLWADAILQGPKGLCCAQHPARLLHDLRPYPRYAPTNTNLSAVPVHKIIDSENFIKVSQNPNKVARDTQGLPTVPHNDFGGLNFKGLASKYLLLMATSPYKITFSKKNHEKNLLESEKTSDSALSGVVRIEIWSSFWFCVSSFWVTALHVNEPACQILRYI